MLVDPVGAQLLGQVEQALAEAEGHARQPVEVGRVADVVVDHEVGAAEQHGQDAVEDLLAERLVVARIAGVLAIVPGRVGLLGEDRRRREPVAAGRGVLHQLQAVDVEQVALVRSITLNGPPPPMASLTILSTWAGVAVPSSTMRAASAQ